MIVRALTKEELNKANATARSSGLRLFEGGSCIIEEGLKVFYVSFDTMAATVGDLIGPKIKEALMADKLVIQSPELRIY